MAELAKSYRRDNINFSCCTCVVFKFLALFTAGMCVYLLVNYLHQSLILEDLVLLVGSLLFASIILLSFIKLLKATSFHGPGKISI